LIQREIFDEKFLGIVAQRLEQGAHNALVAGSIPANPTKIQES
jgi:hypothetical protein